MRSHIQRILGPVERFLAIEAASGIVLMIAAAAALVWANSPWHDFYARLWHIPVGFRFGTASLELDPHFWINDGLMTIFFFVVGLEIRTEIHSGELSDMRRAALPLVAALGGMVMPALIFLTMNSGRASVTGWAVPMATDIAFAVGALALLGKRVAPALRILLLALAVIDDVGAILVIALFYSSHIAASGFAVLALGVLAIFGMQTLGVRLSWAYVMPAFVVWAGAYMSGIHPTLAGVIVGFLTPVRIGERLEQSLHGWVAFGIMPLFAFANAGVPLGQISFEGDALWVFLGVSVGLIVGKPLGVLGLSWFAVRTGLAALPRDIGWSRISVIGMAAGIGFTMALFIADLAFPEGPLLDTAKFAILCGSGFAGALSLVVGVFLSSKANQSKLSYPNTIPD